MSTTKKRKVQSPQQIATIVAEREAASRLMGLGYLFTSMLTAKSYINTAKKHKKDIPFAFEMRQMRRYESAIKTIDALKAQFEKEFAVFAPLPANPPAARPSRKTR